jgi:hypothetical protein
MIKIIATTILWFATSQVQASSPQSPVVLFDQTHGQGALRPPQIEASAKLGLTLRASTAPISAETLAGARLLWIGGPQSAFSAEEMAAVVDYVRRGGSLLVVVDESARHDLAKTNVNKLIEPFGMQLTPDTEYLHNCGAIAKAGEINRSDREIPFSGGRAVEGGTPFAFQLDKGGKPAQPFAAWKKIGGGRVIVMGEGMAALYLGTAQGVRLTGVPRDFNRTTYWGKDTAAFMDEVLGWLVKQ